MAVAVVETNAIGAPSPITQLAGKGHPPVVVAGGRWSAYRVGVIIGPGRRGDIVAAASVVLMIGISGCTGNGSPPPGSTASPTSPSASAPPVRHPVDAGPRKVTQRKPGWALDRIDQRQLPLDKRFTTTGQGQGVTVYVVDGLFDVSNAEFGGRASVGLDLGEACALEDGINHGLFVAGLVAGKRTGVAKQARIVLVGSSYGCEGAEGATEKQAIARIVRALDWVAENARAPAVVNLSLNVNAPAPAIGAAVERLVDAGLTVVASAGNNGEDACQHPPAGLPSVITVGGSAKADKDRRAELRPMCRPLRPGRGRHLGD